MRYYIGIDLGTTGMQSILFDENFNIIEERYTEYPLITRFSGEARQDASLWWDAACAQLLDLSKGRSEKIRAVGICSQGISVVPTDSKFEPLDLAYSWLDTQSYELGEMLSEQFGTEAYFDITARKTPAPYSAAKIAHISKQNPSLAKAAAHFLLPLDFLTAKLCGNTVTDHSMAAGSGIYDWKNKRLSPELLDLFGVRQEKLAHIQNSGNIAGFVTEAAACLTGLAQGTVVALGAQDQKSGAIAAGLSEEVSTLSMGTAYALTIHTKQPVFVKDGFIPLFNTLFDDAYQLECCINTGGAAIKWWRDHLGGGKAYKDMDALIEGFVPGKDTPYCFPHFAGCGHPSIYPNCLAGFHGLSLSTDEAALIYALMEGIAFEIRKNLEAAGKEKGTVYAFGGGAKSKIMLQLMANASGATFRPLAITEAACLGAAIFARMASEESSYEKCRDIALGTYMAKDTITPCSKLQNLMDLRFARYLELEKRLYMP